MNAIDGGEGQRRYEEAGSPMIPSLLVGGRTFPIMHPSQIASLLDIPGTEPGVDSVQVNGASLAVDSTWGLSSG